MPDKHGRWLLALGALAAAALIGGLALWSLSRPPRQIPASPTPLAAPAARQTLPAAVPVASQDAVAWINGNPLPALALTQRQTLDRVLYALLDVPAADDAALDRLINEVLLLGAAESAGFSVTSESVTAEREALLAAHGKSTADLEAALQAEGLPLAAFDAYFTNLIVARDFSAAQAQARGTTAEAFILELRQANDVRVAADSAAAIDAGDAAPPTAPPTAPPEPTPVPVEPTATQIPPTPTADEPRGTATGQRAPGFSLPLLGGDPSAAFDLDAQRGHPMVLSFWVTWCSHCRAQTPLLVDAHARRAAEGIQFVGVNVREGADVVRPYVEQQGIPYAVVLDADGRTAQQYQVSGYPTTYFLDAEGRVIARHVGELNAQALEQYLALLQ